MSKVIELRAGVQSGDAFCTFNGTTLTFGALDANANRVANALIARGMRKGDVVALFSPNRLEVFEAQFGIQRAGAVYTPCSTHCSPDELAYQLQHSEARIVFVDPTLLPVLREIRARCERLAHVVTFDADAAGDAISYRAFLEGHEPTLPDTARRLGQHDLAQVMYTSGTTARPKGVQFSFGNLVGSAVTNARMLGWRPGERYLHHLPMYHAAGGLGPVGPALLTGSTLVMIPRFSASQFSTQLSDYEITLTSVNATIVRMLLSRPAAPRDRDHPCRRMRLGLTLEADDIRAFQERFDTRLLGCYGMTEVVGMCVGDTYGHPQKLSSAGRILDGYELAVVDDEGNQLGANEPGEFIINATHVHNRTLGYHKDPQQTAEVFGDRGIRSGDYGYVDHDGFVWYLERKKDMIKRSGFNVGAAEVERVIRSVPGVRDAAVVGIPDPVRQEAIVAYVVSDGDLTEAVLLAACTESLADYKVPQLIAFVDDLPRGLLGKVDKKALRDDAQRRAWAVPQSQPTSTLR